MSTTEDRAVSRGLPAAGILPGIVPLTRKGRLIKAVWIAVWMTFLAGPVQDLVAGGHSALLTAGAAVGLAAFIGVYFALVFRHTAGPLPHRSLGIMLGVLLGLATVLSLAVDGIWLVLFVYAAVACCAVLPAGRAGWTLGGSVLALVVIGTDFGRQPGSEVWTSFVIPALLAGAAMMSARRTILTMRELRAARATVAHLAANEERLRLARDLHDLLGHSLSLITLKSELASRMLPGQPERAAGEVADIERVSRQALVDVREAVSGYRRPALAAELAGARTALAAAGIAADVPQAEPDGTVAGVRLDRLDTEAEGALAWALREAATNVVRHSGATRCAVVLALQADGTACLTVTDNGGGPDGPDGPDGADGEGNGLTGLRERLALADGVLETAPGVRGGFTLRATVPVRTRAHAQ